MNSDPVVIVAAKRSPIGNFMGQFAHLSAPDLAASCIQDALKNTSIDAHSISEVYLGCVLPAGQGQAPARQAALRAGLTHHTPCTMVNKVCGSGMKAIMLGYDHLRLHPEHILIAGGMESMSNAPHLLMKSRQGKRFGHAELLDHILRDGLEDAYEHHQPMGFFAEQCANQFNITREQQDEFALTSLMRARNSIEKNLSLDEITPILVEQKKQTQLVKHDERPFSVEPSRLTSLPPAFAKHGTVTAGNSSSLSDGAAALILMRLSQANKLHITPLAKIIAHETHARHPAEFTTAPIYAISALMQKIHWTVADTDLFEINEAFAVVVLACLKQLDIPIDRINIHGGACALGHPIGASGARIVTTLLHHLITLNLKRGIAALCIGGGEATAIAIERF